MTEGNPVDHDSVEQNDFSPAGQQAMANGCLVGIAGE